MSGRLQRPNSRLLGDGYRLTVLTMLGSPTTPQANRAMAVAIGQYVCDRATVQMSQKAVLASDHHLGDGLQPLARCYDDWAKAAAYAPFSIQMIAGAYGQADATDFLYLDIERRASARLSL